MNETEKKWKRDKWQTKVILLKGKCDRMLFEYIRLRYCSIFFFQKTIPIWYSLHLCSFFLLLLHHLLYVYLLCCCNFFLFLMRYEKNIYYFDWTHPTRNQRSKKSMHVCHVSQASVVFNLKIPFLSHIARFCSHSHEENNNILVSFVVCLVVC